MKRLRHPIRAIREPFGTAGLIVAMIALVAALGGTAFAAAKLNSTQKKEVEKIAKKFAGKPGANGTNGTNGSPGAKGDAGAAGGNGAAGQSVTGVAATAGECPAGGVKYTSASGNNAVCNGKNGTNGKNGAIQPGETLPTGASETGVWGFQGTPENTYRCVAVAGTGEYEESACRTFAATPGTGNFEREKIYQGKANTVIPISFPIPLAAGIAAANVQIFEGATAPAGCTLTAAGFLEAEPGHLCIRVITLVESVTAAELVAFNLEELGEHGSGRTGAALFVEAKEGFAGAGTWAVTAE